MQDDELMAEITRQICRPTSCGVPPPVKRCTMQASEPCTAQMEKEHFTIPELIGCKWCGSTDTMKYGIRKGVQEYICRACGRKFTTKDTPFKKQSTVEEIGAALNMFYDGMSLSTIGRHLGESFSHPVNGSTVYRWVLRYTYDAIQLLQTYKPKVSGVWVADETVLKIGGEKLWFWDIIDSKTRFLLASHLSRTRTTNDARQLMMKAATKARRTPRSVITDKLAAYLDGIELVFGSDTRHIQSGPFEVENNTNLIERFHGTLKQRTKVLRGFKSIDSTILITDGFLIYYNFFRPHMGLSGKTPAEKAGIDAVVKTWTEVVRKGARDGSTT